MIIFINEKTFYKKLVVVSLIMLAVFVTACADVSKNDENGYTVDFEAMDAPMAITAYGDGAEDAALEAKNLVLSRDDELDAYSTALFVMGLDKARKFQENYARIFDAIFVTKDKRIICTE